jgi:heme oxygenase
MGSTSSYKIRRASRSRPDVGRASELDDCGSSASGWLRSQTREEHIAAETEIDANGLRRRADLANLLIGWIAVWESVSRAASTPMASRAASEELVAPAAQALGWLGSDLADLGYVASAQSRGSSIVGTDWSDRLAELLARPADSWGVAYVLRGSRMGGAVLAARLRSALALRGDCGTSFLTSGGTRPGREWREFCGRLDSVTFSPAELTAGVTAARWTFGWIGAQVSSSRSAASAAPA